MFTGPNDAYVLLGQAGLFNGIAITHDGGRNWVVKAGGETGLPERASWSQTLAGSFAATPNSLVVTIGGSVFRTTNGGATWQRSTGAGGVIDLAYDGRNSRVVGVTRSGVVTSSDGGASFSSIPGSPGGTRSAVDGIGRIYVVDWQGAGLLRFDGASWVRLRTDSLIYDVVVDPTDNRRIVAVTNDYPFHDDAAASGVWITTDDGANWVARNEGLSMTRISTAAFDPYVRGRLVVGSYGAGFWEIQLPDGPIAPPLTTPTTVPVKVPTGKTLTIDRALMGALADAAREQERALIPGR